MKNPVWNRLKHKQQAVIHVTHRRFAPLYGERSIMREFTILLKAWKQPHNPKYNIPTSYFLNVVKKASNTTSFVC